MESPKKPYMFLFIKQTGLCNSDNFIFRGSLYSDSFDFHTENLLKFAGELCGNS